MWHSNFFELLQLGRRHESTRHESSRHFNPVLGYVIMTDVTIDGHHCDGLFF